MIHRLPSLRACLLEDFLNELFELGTHVSLLGGPGRQITHLQRYRSDGDRLHSNRIRSVGLTHGVRTSLHLRRDDSPTPTGRRRYDAIRRMLSAGGIPFAVSTGHVRTHVRLPESGGLHRLRNWLH